MAKRDPQLSFCFSAARIWNVREKCAPGLGDTSEQMSPRRRKTKRKEVDCGFGYKQATPMGFEIIPPMVRAWVEGNATSVRKRLILATHVFIASAFLLCSQALA